MHSWRDAILDDFVPKVSKLTLVADPDGLLTEEKLALALRERGFALLEFNDPIAFRYAYESQYRALWDRGESTDLVVVLRVRDAELQTLPYDLLQAGRKLAFSLGELFPNLSYPVIEKLDRGLLDALFAAQSESRPDRMGDDATKDFVLRHVFGIAAELLKNETELLRALLQLHYGQLRLPPILAERLVRTLQRHPGFAAWPLAAIVPDGEAFFAFLQERWPLFLSRWADGGQVREEAPGYNLKYPGPEALPFDHQDIKVYIDNLFLEGKLTPVAAPDVVVDAKAWIRCGIAAAGADDDAPRVARLFALVEKTVPGAEARGADWLAFALKWAELSSLVHGGDDDAQQNKLQSIGDALNAAFAAWLPGHYASLVNLPPANPAMLHHVPRRLARDLEDAPDGRVALILVDGLALDQWVTIRQLLQRQIANVVMREAAVFAWIPTLTAVSRQAAFSGQPPFYFPTTINSTDQDGKHWQRFWEDQGLDWYDVVYRRGLGDDDVAEVFDAITKSGKARAVGLVVDKVDKIMHGMQLGAAGMHNQVKQWAQKKFLAALIDRLLQQGYAVWLTSDHGNIECAGQGRPSEGVIAETRGKRVRVYPTPELRAQVAKDFPFARAWPPLGLPAGYFPLVADGRGAFANPGETLVGHGGIAIEEVIVPLVKFERKEP